MKRMLNRMLRFYKIKAASFFRRVTRLLKKPTRLEAAEKCPDAGRVAPISACVSYQIDRLKSGFEAMGRTVMPGNCALMGATRLASGFFQQPHLAGIFLQPRDASPPLELAFFLDFITFLHHLIGWRVDEARVYVPRCLVHVPQSAIYSRL